MALPTISKRWQPYVLGLIAAVAGAIGWDAVYKGIDVGIEYARTNAAPEDVISPVVSSSVPFVVSNSVPDDTVVSETGYSDAIDIEKINIVGKHRMDPRKAKIVSELHSARIEGGNVRLSFDPLNGWPTSGSGKVCDGGVCILWRDGDGFIGGWFDHHGRGQVVKTLGNIPGGYVDGRRPSPGADVWFYIISYDSKMRTTICSGGTWR